jgi:hypothetical protein
MTRSNMRRNRSVMIAAALALAAAAGSPASACKYNVREAGFLAGNGVPYRPASCRILYISKLQNVKALRYIKLLRTYLGKELKGTNASPVLYSLNKMPEKMVTQLKERYKLDTEKLPETIVVRSFEPHIEELFRTNGQLPPEMIKSFALSPWKIELKRALLNTANYCVAVFVPGADEKESAKALETLKEAIAEHVKKKPKELVQVIELKWNVPDPFFMGELGVGHPNEGPVVGFVFGKGCLLLPLLKKEKITKEAVHKLFWFLNHNAADCGPDAIFFRNEVTRDLLMQWEQSHDRRLVIDAMRAAGLDVPKWKEAPVDPETGELLDPAKVRDKPDAHKGHKH